MYEVRLTDKIKNYPLKDKEGFLYCLFEGVSNALYACKDNDEIKIKIDIKRQYMTNAIKNESKDSLVSSLTISDNGDGFTDENFSNFTKKYRNIKLWW